MKVQHIIIREFEAITAELKKVLSTMRTHLLGDAHLSAEYPPAAGNMKSQRRLPGSPNQL